MSPGEPLQRPSRGTVLWFAASAVVVHAFVREFEAQGGLGLTAGLGFLAGALPLLPGALGRDYRRALLEPLAGGMALAGVSLLFLPVLDRLGAWIDADTLLPLHASILLGLLLVALLQSGTAARLRTLIGVEWMKLRKGRLLRVGLLVAALATLLTALAHAPVENESGWTQAARSTGVGFWTAEILVLVLGATAVAGEASQGTLKMILPHAYRRAEWVAAKAVVLLLAAALFVAIVVLIGVGHAALDPGLGDVTRTAAGGFGEDDEVQVFVTATTMWEYLQETILASAMSLVASALLGLLLSCLFGTLVPALSASFLVFAALKAGEMFLGLSPETLAHLHTHYPDELRRLTENFGRALNERWDPRLVLMGTYLSTITAAAALLLGMRLFGRRDLHE